MFGSSFAQDSRFKIPPLSQTAFLLDFDGTLVDIAPTPEAVVVPPDLRETLSRLRAACGDALAIISGRPIDQIDQFLGDVPFAVAGEHGVAIRHRPGGPIERAVLPSMPQRWLVQASDLLATLPALGWSISRVVLCCITAQRPKKPKYCARLPSVGSGNPMGPLRSSQQKWHGKSARPGWIKAMRFPC